MHRIACGERPDWKTKAEEAGFRFHTIDGDPYWDERAYYAFTPKDADQYNSLHERLIEGWTEIGKGGHVHLAGAIDDPEDGGTLAYMEDTARQAGLATTVLPMDQIGRTPKGAFVDLANKPIE